MTALGKPASSLFSVPTHRELQTHGSSVTSYAWEPHEESQRKAKKVYYENTYKMEPPEKFRSDKVKPIIEKVLATNLEGRKYDPIECSILSKALSDDIKQQIQDNLFGDFGPEERPGGQCGQSILVGRRQGQFCNRLLA
ncbi:TC1D1-like protein [Mya arenaria]|uniref:TC1D1-like protein n=1 Tax=Mya arenaria TaxID=6604 RepID=A0ABY7FPX2_MYAAR|nr:TC1D1-like protein [Mya arenaria]